ncbi:MAG: ABC transporter ATP-binding protein [Thermoproteota archaeon]
MNKPLLECKAVTKSFGKFVALNGVDLTVNEGELLGLIGPNGSGKTTLVNCISGFYKPTTGNITFMGKNIVKLKSYSICKMGIARTFQVPRPFLRLTVLENVMVSAGGNRDFALKCVERVGLSEIRDVQAKNLTFHQIRLMEIARALALKPKLLLLDEVMSGLNPVEVDESIKLLEEIRKAGVTILWIEHVMRAIMKAADRIAVLQEGKKIAEGKPKEIANDEKVIAAYLGKRYIL